MNKVKKAAVAFLATVSTLMLSTAVYAGSILPSDINQQFADAKTDILTVIGLCMSLLLVIVGWRYIRRSAS